MFAPYQLESLNSTADLPPSVYEGMCTIFRSPESGKVLWVCEYRHGDTGRVHAVDLLTVEPTGEIRMRDFVLMPDDSWRDSYGARSDFLEALFPIEVFEYPAIERLALAPQTVRGVENE